MLRKLNHERRKTPLGQASVLLTCLGLTVYFAVHAISGKHGFEARSRLFQRSAVLEQEIAGLVAVRVRLEREIALLGAVPPDSDLVAQLARDRLGFLYDGDIVVVAPEK